MKVSCILPVEATHLSTTDEVYLLLEARDFLQEEAARKGRRLVGDVTAHDPLPFSEVEVVGGDIADYDFDGLVAFPFSAETEVA